MNFIPQKNILGNKLGKTLSPTECEKWEEELEWFLRIYYKTEDNKGRYVHETEMLFNAYQRRKYIFPEILGKGRKESDVQVL